MDPADICVALVGMSNEEVVVITWLVIQHLRAPYASRFIVPRFCLTTRARYLEVLMNPRQCWESLGCSVSTFLALSRWIAPQVNRRTERHVQIEEKVALFLYICRQASGHRNCENYFARSASTVTQAFNQILSALVSLHPEIVQQPTEGAPAPQKIANNPKFTAFRDCIGAIDGTHFHARVPAKVNGVLVNQKPWLNHKGFLSQNVTAACDFDLKFSFVHAGYEGSAHDAAVLKDAIRKRRFQPLAGRYYLADAGYYHSDYLLKPYTATRYHLREWNEPGTSKPATKQELFNLRHSQLRCHIERIFGVLKRKFKILATTPQYSLSQQRDLVVALTAVFNFIADRDRKYDAEILDPLPPIQYEPPQPPSSIITTHISDAEEKRMENKRDKIADEMWTEYKRIIDLRKQALFLIDDDI